MAAAPRTARRRDESRLLAEIRVAVGSRPDFLLSRINTGVYAAPSAMKTRIRSAPNGFPDLIGTQLRRVLTRRTVETNFSRYEGPEYWHTYGQAIAVETKTVKGQLSQAQQAWALAFRKVGGIYILARTVEDVTNVLGMVGTDAEWLAAYQAEMEKR